MNGSCRLDVELKVALPVTVAVSAFPALSTRCPSDYNYPCRLCFCRGDGGINGCGGGGTPPVSASDSQALNHSSSSSLSQLKTEIEKESWDVGTLYVYLTRWALSMRMSHIRTRAMRGVEFGWLMCTGVFISLIADPHPPMHRAGWSHGQEMPLESDSD